MCRVSSLFVEVTSETIKLQEKLALFSNSFVPYTF